MTVRRATGLAAAFALAAARPVSGGSTIVNTGTATFQNDDSIVQLPVTAAVNFTVQANPVVQVVKTRLPAFGVKNQRVEYSLAVTYPQLGAVCGDDSPAAGVSLTDTIPAGMTYVVNSTSVSVDNGATFSLGTDAADGVDVPGVANVTFAANQVRVLFVNPLPECTGGATTRVVKFAVTVN